MQVDKARLDDGQSFEWKGKTYYRGPLVDYGAFGSYRKISLTPFPTICPTCGTRSLRSTEGKEVASLGAAINFAEAYVAGYEFDDGDGGFHTPTEAERLVMLDMINGLFSEDGFVAALTRSPE